MSFKKVVLILLIVLVVSALNTWAEETKLNAPANISPPDLNVGAMFSRLEWMRLVMPETQQVAVIYPTATGPECTVWRKEKYSSFGQEGEGWEIVKKLPIPGPKDDNELKKFFADWETQNSFPFQGGTVYEKK